MTSIQSWRRKSQRGLCGLPFAFFGTCMITSCEFISWIFLSAVHESARCAQLYWSWICELFVLHSNTIGARVMSVIAQDALAEYRTWPLDTSVQALSHRSVAASLMGSPGGTDLSGVSRAINARLCSHSAEHSSPWPSQPFAGLIINEVLRALLWFQVAPGQIDDSAQKRYVPVVCLFSCRPDLRI